MDAVEKYGLGFRIISLQVWGHKILKNNTFHFTNPPLITHAMMNNIFGRVPGTQNPPELTYEEWINFSNELKI